LPNGEDAPSRLHDLLRMVLSKSILPIDGNALSWDERNEGMAEILHFLWLCVVQPVCKALALEDDNDDDDDLTTNDGDANERFMRITWITTGPFNGLPIQAAWMGANRRPSYHIISSFASSFRTLEFARSKSTSSPEFPNAGLLVTMPGLSKSKRLRKVFVRSADQEAINVINSAGKITWKRLDRPSAEVVKEDLTNITYLHVISHGVSDVQNPSQSHLVLWKQESQDLSNPANVDRLPVSEISKLVTKNAKLAFLAACSTAETSHQGLVDEGLQIGNAFQLAGFPHVIASLWPAYDWICPQLARQFYSLMTAWATSTEHRNLIPLALHLAVFRIASENLSEPLLWANFVHMGA